MTAVEWLINQLHKKQYGDYPDLSYNQMFDQAKELEKQQIIDAYNKSFELRDKPYSTADKYYISTYASKGSDMSEKLTDHVPEVRKTISEKYEDYKNWLNNKI